MQLDRKMLERVRKLDDRQLSLLVEQIAKEAGIDPAALGLDPKNLAGLRQALASVNEEQLAGLGEIYENYRRNRRGR